VSALREGTKRLFVRMPPKLMACVRASARIYGKIDALLVARAAPGAWRRKPSLCTRSFARPCRERAPSDRPRKQPS
jgi:hypothetical protein